MWLCRAIILLSLLACVTTPADAAYSFYRKFTINHLKVANTDRSNFKFEMGGSYSDMATVANGGHVTSSSGYDIQPATSASCTTFYPFELVAYDPTAGGIHIYALITTVSHTVDTDVYLCYADATVTTNRSNLATTWAGYSSVYHFVNSGGLTMLDSSGNGNTAVNHGATLGNSIVGAGTAKFDAASSTYIDLGAQPQWLNGTNTKLTVSMWVKNSNISAFTYPLASDTANANQVRIFFGFDNAAPNNISLAYNHSTWPTNYVYAYNTASSFTSNSWHRITVALDFTTTANSKIYFDGLPVTPTLDVIGPAIPTANPLGGSVWLGYGKLDLPIFFTGEESEVRLSNVLPNADEELTEFNNQSNLGTFFTAGASTAVPTGACNGFSNVATFTVNPPAAATQALSFFPVVLTGSYGGALNAAGGIQSASGFDQCYSDMANTTSYNLQIRNYSSTNGINTVVQVPSLAGYPSTTSFKVYWGKTGVTINPSTNPWDGGFAQVYALQENALNYIDATGGGNDLNFGTIPTRVAGPLPPGFAQTFLTASSQYLRAPSGIPSDTTDHLISMWFKTSSNNTSGDAWALVDIRDPNNSLIGTVSYINTTNHAECFTFPNGFPLASPSTINDGQWHYLACMVDVSYNVHMWFDGVEVTPVANPSYIPLHHVPVYIAARPSTTGGAPEAYFDGSIAEVRISKISRLSSWPINEAANLLHPSTFITFAGAAPTVTSFTASPNPIKAGQSTTISWTTSGAATSVTLSPYLYGTDSHVDANAAGSITIPVAVTTTFSLIASNGGGSSAPSTVTVTANSATIDAFTPACTGNSPNSILCTWSTTVSGSPAISDSQLTCGTAATTAQDPIVVNTNVFYGVSTHRIAVTGSSLLPSTLYTCTATSKSLSGTSTTSSPTTATTTAALSFTSIMLSHFSPPIYFNDQFNGIHGFTANQQAYNSDSMWGTWADDGFVYVAGNDFTGKYNPNSSACCSNNIGVARFSADRLSVVMKGAQTGSNNTGPALANNYPTTYTADGGRAYAEDMVSVNGNMYEYTLRGTNSCSVIFKTTDHWATNLGPKRNIGPLAIGLPFTPSGNYDYPTNATTGQCTVDGGPATGPTYYLWPMQIGQDWGGITGQFNVGHNQGTDAYVYFTIPDPPLTSFGLARVAVEDIQITSDITRYQSFNGTTCSDWLDPTKWVTGARGAGTIYSHSTWGDKPQIAWLKGLNHWIMLTWLWFDISDVDQSGAIGVYDLGACPVPNSPVLLGTLPMDPVTYTNFYPAFPQFNLFSLTANANGSYTVLLTMTGSYRQVGTTPNPDRYSPTYRWLTFSPVASAASARTAPLMPATKVSYLGGRNSHIGNGLDVFWDFNTFSWSTVIPDRAPAQKYAIGVAPGILIINQQGMPAGIAGTQDYGNPRKISLPTNYNPALTDFTTAACFKWSQDQPFVNGATLIDRGTDFRIQHGSSANQWNILVKGTTIGPITIPDGTWDCLTATRSGSTVNVYKSSTLEDNTQLVTPTATGSASGAFGTTSATLGSLIGGTQPFYGTIGEYLTWSRALSPTELIKEMHVLRSDLRARFGSPTIP